MCPQAFQGEFGVEMRHMWGMTELSPIGSCAGFKVWILLSQAFLTCPRKHMLLGRTGVCVVLVSSR